MARERKVRKLSGWNAFQRHRTAGLQLSQHDYDKKIKELSREWRRMSAELKDEFRIEAEWQQVQIDDLTERPLPAKDEQETEAAEAVWKNAKKKISVKRLARNEEALENHRLWDMNAQMGDCALANACVFLPTPVQLGYAMPHMPHTASFHARVSRYRIHNGPRLFSFSRPCCHRDCEAKEPSRASSLMPTRRTPRLPKGFQRPCTHRGLHFGVTPHMRPRTGSQRISAFIFFVVRTQRFRSCTAW